MKLLLMTSTGFGVAICASTILFGLSPKAASAEEEPSPAIRIEISTPEPQVMFRAAIPLTITYTNISKEVVVLSANGARGGRGFPGEWFDVTLGKKTKRYMMYAIDPGGGQVVKLEPGESWARTFPSLAAELSGSGVAIDGKIADTRRMPDPFGHPGEYLIRIGYENTIQNQPKPEFTGQAESKELKLNITRF